ncbi:hypothetical protein IW140_000353 [Coemansia sp. RSA 1813]|nr:hypothetical protein EV178_000690 [Coemansia sp. RSA 1646]KAJ1773225.1 hypothetical protein LPJ74_000735 [Coemansia sp. RSA 1843]KAJ2092693.1 hypothetical protein IW138_000787 [Coemansia sp. RSA 986]KAJ2217810.1 hypothetical protein EV179_000296 [Coemansia sp. RSA 487]KAJ2572955.1 hypothetical protein IW140_000353 [Coemansia sp. RSA 1813]
MVAVDTATSPISYDLSKYAHLDKEWKTQPYLHLNRYFAEHFYASTAAPKRKHGEIEEQQAPEPLDILAAESVTKEWQYVLMSPNKLCVIGISKHHPLFLQQSKQEEDASIVTKVVFADNVRNSVIKGKGKKQSLRVMPDTKICTIQTSNGKEYVVRAAIKGVLMEWNSRLEASPQLITTNPEQAFVAIVKPPTDDNSKILSECVNSV